MVEVAEIFRAHGPEYLAKYGGRMPCAHKRAMRDILQCRTPALGGEVYVCGKCHAYRYSYHSCKNRHCPKCGNDQAVQWVEQQKLLLLPVIHFLVTFTLPEELRKVARANQKLIYNILFRASSEALQKLAEDERFVGGRLGMVGVLHTWTRALIYHPHVHYIVTGGALNDRGVWRSSREDFLVPVRALSVIFRAKFRDLLKKTELFDQVDLRVWKKDWVVHSEAVGSGEAAFKYLAPYVFRVAISNKRILKLQDGRVTFKYKDSATDQVRYATVSAEEFIRRFLQHVLPDHFVKVRYYGLLSCGNRHLLNRARELLTAKPDSRHSDHSDVEELASEPMSCPNCGSQMALARSFKARGRAPP
jgi:Putative transposase/Transposase zinc-binding domain